MIRNILQALWDTFSPAFIIFLAIGAILAIGVGMVWLISSFTYGWLYDIIVLVVVFSGQNFGDNYRKVVARNRPR